MLKLKKMYEILKRLFYIPILSTLGVLSNSQALTIATDAMSPLPLIINDSLYASTLLKIIVYSLIPIAIAFVSTSAINMTNGNQYFYTETPKFKEIIYPQSYIQAALIGFICGTFSHTFPLDTILLFSIAIATAFTSSLTRIGVKFAQKEPIWNDSLIFILTIMSYAIGYNLSKFGAHLETLISIVLVITLLIYLFITKDSKEQPR